jgi:hypothetical protein
VKPRDVRDFVSGLLRGGGQPTSGAPAPDDTAAADTNVTVDVRNASGRTGLAAQVSQALTAQGFQTGETGNATTRATSVVRFATGEDSSAERVASALGGVPAEADRTVPKGRVTVLLGKDFRLGAGQQSAGRQSTAAPNPAPSTGQPAGPALDGCVN